MKRVYLFPVLYKNISDNETYALVKEHKHGLVCDPVRKVMFLWVSKYSSPFFEPNGCWIEYKEKG